MFFSKKVKTKTFKNVEINYIATVTIYLIAFSNRKGVRKRTLLYTFQFQHF